MGYSNVLDYEGGKQDWIDAGYSVIARHLNEQQAAKDASTNPEEDVA
jgi:hypothetical protein